MREVGTRLRSSARWQWQQMEVADEYAKKESRLFGYINLACSLSASCLHPTLSSQHNLPASHSSLLPLLGKLGVIKKKKPACGVDSNNGWRACGGAQGVPALQLFQCGPKYF